MKKVVLIALVITGIIAGSIIIGGFLSKNQKDTNTSSSTNQSSSDTSESTQPTGQSEQSTAATYTTAQVAEHNTASNCWIIISNQVYDVTKFIPEHPGGAGQITAYCGKDATQAFETQGGEGSHSSTAQSLKAKYLIGSLQ